MTAWDSVYFPDSLFNFDFFWHDAVSYILLALRSNGQRVFFTLFGVLPKELITFNIFQWNDGCQ